MPSPVYWLTVPSKRCTPSARIWKKRSRIRCHSSGSTCSGQLHRALHVREEHASPACARPRGRTCSGGSCRPGAWGCSRGGRARRAGGSVGAGGTPPAQASARPSRTATRWISASSSISSSRASSSRSNSRWRARSETRPLRSRNARAFSTVSRKLIDPDPGCRRSDSTPWGRSVSVRFTGQLGVFRPYRTRAI